MIGRFAFIASVALSLSAQGIAQQGQTGSIVPVDPKAVDQKAAGMIRKNFARCSYVRVKRTADRFLAASDIFFVDQAGARVGDYVTAFDLEECLGDEARPGEYALVMRLKPATLRDLYAEEAYLSRHPQAPVLSAAPPAFVFRPARTDRDVEHAQAVARLGDCAILRDVQGADALLRTMPGSDAERAAAVKVAPALGGCMLQGETFTMTPASIRSLVAYAMWSRFVREGAPQ